MLLLGQFGKFRRSNQSKRSSGQQLIIRGTKGGMWIQIKYKLRNIRRALQRNTNLPFMKCLNFRFLGPCGQSHPLIIDLGQHAGVILDQVLICHRRAMVDNI